MNPPSTQPDRELPELNHVFAQQRARFRAAPYPPARERKAHLAAVRRLLLENTGVVVRAIRQDFGCRSEYETKLLEFFPSLLSVGHARARLAKWMRPECRSTSIWFRPGRSKLVKQPLGVVGVIVPWNYPLSLAIGPLTSALAAGNRVMIKMSEFTPRFGELFAELVEKYFARDHVAVVNGGVEVAQAFSRLPFDHLLFTGSTAVGRLVMRAAAENLTPVTLELGGKSPAIIAPEFPPEVAARRIMLGKCWNAGQTCIAPDYLLLPESQVQSFARAARQEVSRLYPSIPASPDYTAIITERHYSRLVGCLEDARAKGAAVEPLGESAPAVRKLAPALLTNLTDDMLIMQEEIFGPFLPLVTYRTLEQALDYVAGHPRPLALYYFDYRPSRIQRVLNESISGGVTINDVLLHFPQDDLPFGGVGPSGMGRYHGQEGFKTFSNCKGVFIQSRLNTLPLLKPPSGKLLAAWLRIALR